MTDLPAAWHPDPTGRHDHRYWDGARWTDHVADSGVAASDDFRPSDAATVGPPGSAPAPAPEPSAGPEAPDAATDPATEAPAAEVLSWSPPAVTRPTPEATPTSEAHPETETSAEASTVGPERLFPSPTPTSSPTSPTSPAEPAPSARPTPVVGADAPTVVTPAPDATRQVPLAAPLPAAAPFPGAEPAPLPAPERPSGDGPSAGHGTRNVLVGVAVLVVVALVAFLAVRGSDDDDSESAIAARMSETLRSGSGSLSKKDADCVSKAVVHEVGANRLKDVDFGSETVQAGPLASDLQKAVGTAYSSCKVSSGPSADPFASDGDTGGGGAVPSLPGGSSDLGALGNIDDFEKQLADGYESSLHLSHEKATCLADAMAQAVKDGKLDQEHAFGEFFDYLDKCGVSLDEITPAAGNG